MDNLDDLQTKLATYKAAEKMDESTLAFHGELSPFSNFHSSPFWEDGILFKIAKHYIQSKKAHLFVDSTTANQILRSDTAIDAQRLSYNISDYNTLHWTSEGLKICSKGTSEKFIQNKPLLEMLKTTS